MSTKKPVRNKAPKQELLSAKRLTSTMDLGEVGHRLESAKTELSTCLTELAQEKGTITGETLSKDLQRLQLLLRNLDELIRPIPPFHK